MDILLKSSLITDILNFAGIRGNFFLYLIRGHRDSFRCIAKFTALYNNQMLVINYTIK